MAGRRPSKTRYRSGRPFVEKDTPRKRMLDEGRLAHFRYDLREVLKESRKLDDELVTSFAQTVMTKASRLGVGEAKEFVDEKQHEGVVEKDDRDAIFRLLDRYSTYR